MYKTCNRAYTYDIIDYLYRHFAVSENRNTIRNTF